MEYKKKKNEANRSQRNVLIGIALIVGLLMIYGAVIAWHQFRYGESDYWFPTASAIVATNEHISTLLAQTQVVATEQFMVTRTALP